MFYSTTLLAKSGPLAQIWLAATWEKKLTKSTVSSTDIPSSVDAILSPSQPLALRLCARLLVGVARIYYRKASYLASDCAEAMIRIRMAFLPGNVELPAGSATAAKSSITVATFDDIDPTFDVLETTPTLKKKKRRLGEDDPEEEEEDDWVAAAAAAVGTRADIDMPGRLSEESSIEVMRGGSRRESEAYDDDSMADLDPMQPDDDSLVGRSSLRRASMLSEHSYVPPPPPQEDDAPPPPDDDDLPQPPRAAEEEEEEEESVEVGDAPQPEEESDEEEPRPKKKTRRRPMKQFADEKTQLDSSTIKEWLADTSAILSKDPMPPPATSTIDDDPLAQLGEDMLNSLGKKRRLVHQEEPEKRSRASVSSNDTPEVGRLRQSTDTIATPNAVPFDDDFAVPPPPPDDEDFAPPPPPEEEEEDVPPPPSLPEEDSEEEHDWHPNTVKVATLAKDRVGPRGVEFDRLTAGLDKKTTVSVFVELLHLHAWRVVKLEQQKPTSPIRVSRAANFHDPIPSEDE